LRLVLIKVREQSPLKKKLEQSLKQVVIYIYCTVSFSYDHVYVAVSRITFTNGFKMLLVDDKSVHANSTSNAL
jgi:hypothetical protein